MQEDIPPVSILVADDDGSTRRMLELALTRQGYEVGLADGGPEAIRLLGERAYDVLISDMHMPGMDGLAVCAEAKRLRPGIGLVLITGFKTEASVLRAFREGVNAYVRKPIELASLFRKLDSVVEALGEPGGRDSPAAADGEGVALALGEISAEAAELLAGPELAEFGLAADKTNWLTFTAPSHRTFLESFTDLCSLLLTGGVEPDTVEELKVAILELGSNAIEWGHGSDRGRPIRLGAKMLDDTIAIVVQDDGPGFRLEEVPDPTSAARELQRQRADAGKRPGGYGIALVRAIADRIAYNDTGNVVAVVKRLRARQTDG